MLVWAAVGIAGVFAGCSPARGQAKASTVFFLEESGGTEWCAYRSEELWRGKMAKTPATIFGTLTFGATYPTRFDLGETDSTGAWAVNDHYFFDAVGQINRLVRLTNMAEGDRSVQDTYLITEGVPKLTARTEKQLSTGKPLPRAKAEPIHEIPVETTTKTLPFAVLLGHTGLRTSERFCMAAPGH